MIPGEVTEGDAEKRELVAGETTRDDLLRRLVRWLPLAMLGHLIIGVPALLISLVVAYGTYVQAEATRQIQQAASWPFLAYRTTNYSPAGQRIISFTLANNGLGPAMLGRVEVSYAGRPMRSGLALLEACCGFNRGEPVELRSAPVLNVALRPGQELTFLSVPDVRANKNLIERLETARTQMRVRACYCSIFGECWAIDGPESPPRAMKACPSTWTSFRSVTG